MRDKDWEKERKGKREKGKKRERERDSFGILDTGYLLSIVKIKRKIERDREKKR